MIKKFFWICVAAAVISFLLPTVHTLRLSSVCRDGLVANNVRCGRLAKELSAIEGVWEVAVLQRDGAVLVGLRCQREDCDRVRIKARRLAKDYFPTCTRIIGVEDNTALEITQLAYLLQSDLHEDVLKSRFRYLANKENSLFDKM